MIYERHHYADNFMNAAGNGDMAATRDILLNRLVDTVALKKDAVVNALNVSGIKTAPDANSFTVLKNVLANTKNKTLVQKVDLIVGPTRVSPQKSNADGSLDLTGIGAISGGLASLLGGIDSLSNPNKALNVEQEKTKQAQLQLQAAQLLAAKTGQNQPLSGWAIAGIITGSLVVVGIGFAIIIKKMK